MSEKTFKPLDDMIENSGLKLDYIAEKMGITRMRLYQMRVNPISMSFEQMEKLADILGVSTEYVLKIRRDYNKGVE